MAGKLSCREFREYLYQHDIVGLVETFGKEGEVFELSGYFSINKNKGKKNKLGRAPSGITVFVKNNLQQFVKEECINSNDVVWIRVTWPIKCFLGVVYNHPDNSKYVNEGLFDELEDMVTNLMMENPEYKIVLIGDLNARTGQLQEYAEIEESRYDNVREGAVALTARNNQDKGVNRAGRKLINLCNVTTLVIVNGRTNGDRDGKFTYVSEQGCSVIDYCLCSTETLEYISSFKIEDLVECKHQPLVLKLRTNVNHNNSNSSNTNVDIGSESQGASKIMRIKWENEHLNSFKSRINDKISDLYLKGVNMCVTKGETENANKILNALYYAAGKEMIGSKGNLKAAAKNQWYDEECLDARRLALSSLRKFRRQKDNMQYLTEYLGKRNKYRETCRRKKTEWNDKWVQQLNLFIRENEHRKAWRMIKNIGRKETHVSVITAKQWVQHFEAILGEKDDWVGHNLRTREPVINVAILDDEILLTEVEAAMKGMKNNKTGGIDAIPSEFYKISACNKEITRTLTRFYNKLMDGAEIPKSWGTGVVCPLYKKKGSIRDPNNYRGITLLPIVSKIYTKILADRIQKWEQINNKITAAQAGFRRGFSTIDNLFVIRTVVDKELARKRGKVYGCFVDLEKAFDKVSRNALYYKLQQSGMSTSMIQRIRAIYKQVNFCIKANSKEVTSLINSRLGLRQGCQLSPILFSLFMNDVEMKIHDAQTHPPQIGEASIPLLMYADDLVILSRTVVGMQRALNALSEYCDQWKLRVNTGKTKMMVFKNGSKQSKVETWSYKDSEIEKVKSFKYLGVTLAFNGLWRTHQNIAAESANKNMLIARRAAYKDTLPVTMLTRIFDTMVQPVLTYGCEVWGTHCDSKIIEKANNKFCKQVLGVNQAAANSGVVAEMGRVTTKTIIKTRIIGYWLKLREDDDRILQKQCLEFQTRNRKNNSWLYGVDLILNEVGNGGLVHEQKIDHPKKTFKIIKEALKQRDHNEIIADCKKKTTLNILAASKSDVKKEKYIEHNKKTRRAIATMRLGTWKWKGWRDAEGVRKCVFCQGEETEAHLLFECEGYRGERVEEITKIYNNMQNGVVKMLSTENTNEIKQLAEQIQKILNKREQEIEKKSQIAIGIHQIAVM